MDALQENEFRKKHGKTYIQEFRCLTYLLFILYVYLEAFRIKKISSSTLKSVSIIRFRNYKSDSIHEFLPNKRIK